MKMKMIETDGLVFRIEEDNAWYESDVTEEKLAEYKKIQTDYDAMQEELYNLEKVDLLK